MASQEVVPTHSPSMDIQVSSNFERLLFEALGRDSSRVADLMATFSETGSYSVPTDEHGRFGDGWGAERVDDDETIATIASVFDEHDIVIDPHTAVAVAAARRQSGPGPYVVLATAHPAKFSDAVRAATGVATTMPPALSGLSGLPERAQRAPADAGLIAGIVREIATRGAGPAVDDHYRGSS
jgi:threonine synthase